jgi:hypothetical protein
VGNRGIVGRCPEPLRAVGRAACEPVDDAAAPVEDIDVELAACVTPNPADDEEGVVMTVTNFVEDVWALLVDTACAEVVWRDDTDDTGDPEPSPIAKSPEVAYTSDMLFKATASSLYPSPIGTTGKVIVLEPSSVATLSAMAKELWKRTLRSSMWNTPGSPGLGFHDTVTVCAEFQPWGVLKVNALAPAAKSERQVTATLGLK